MIVLRKRGPGIISILAAKLEKKYPSLPIDLELAGIEQTPREYLTKCLGSSLILFIIFLSFIIVINIFTGFSIKTLFFFIIAVLLGFFMYTKNIKLPKIIARKRMMDIDKNLVPALRNMTIQMSSGMPLYNVMASISGEDYGILSGMVKDAVNKIAIGTDEIDALEEISRKSPSENLKRVIEHIVNGIVSGGETATTLRHLTESTAQMQVIEIQNYGNKVLRTISMVYTVAIIVLPALAFVFLVGLYSFVKIPIPPVIPFSFLLAFVFILQFLLAGYIKTTMPTRVRE